MHNIKEFNRTTIRYKDVRCLPNQPQQNPTNPYEDPDPITALAQVLETALPTATATTTEQSDSPAAGAAVVDNINKENIMEETENKIESEKIETEKGNKKMNSKSDQVKNPEDVLPWNYANINYTQRVEQLNSAEKGVVTLSLDSNCFDASNFLLCFSLDGATQAEDYYDNDFKDNWWKLLKNKEQEAANYRTSDNHQVKTEM